MGEVAAFSGAGVVNTPTKFHCSSAGLQIKFDDIIHMNPVAGYLRPGQKDRLSCLRRSDQTRNEAPRIVGGAIRREQSQCDDRALLEPGAGLAVQSCSELADSVE